MPDKHFQSRSKLLIRHFLLLYLKQMKAINCLTIIGFLCIHGTYGIVGYNCGTTNLNI